MLVWGIYRGFCHFHPSVINGSVVLPWLMDVRWGIYTPWLFSCIMTILIKLPLNQWIDSKVTELLVSWGVSVCLHTMQGNNAKCMWPQRISPELEQEEETDSLEDESDKPRFTLQELRDVLQERNELKAQVFVLEEELAYYRRYVLFPKFWFDLSQRSITLNCKNIYFTFIKTLYFLLFTTFISSICLSEELKDDASSVVYAPSPPPCTDRPESGIRRLWVISLT